MTERELPAETLPEYAAPPVVEVAASVQFANIKAMDAARLGLLWGRFRDAYPLTEQHPPLPRAHESINLAGGGLVRFSLERPNSPQRLWFLKSDGTRLVQVQSDRLVVNWRKLDSAEPYLRYSSVREMLREALTIFTQFLEDEQLGKVEPQHMELTYVNHVPAIGQDGNRAPLSSYLSCWRGEPASLGLANAEETSFRTQYILPCGSNTSGRLLVELESAYANKTRAPIYVLNILARGAPDEPTLASAFDFFDASHRWIVHAFTEFTTTEAHTLWKRQL